MKNKYKYNNNILAKLHPEIIKFWEDEGFTILTRMSLWVVASKDVEYRNHDDFKYIARLSNSKTNSTMSYLWEGKFPYSEFEMLKIIKLKAFL